MTKKKLSPVPPQQLMPGEVVDAVYLAKQDLAGDRLLTYAEYRKISRALNQVHAELTKIKREVCPARSQGHVRSGDDVQCTLCHAYLPKG